MSTTSSPSLRIPAGDIVQNEGEPRLESAELLRAYRSAVLLRALDEHATRLAADRKIPMHASCRGHEAVLVGAAMALRDRDWVFATAREALSAIVRGMPVRAYFDQLFGNAKGASKGRQPPGAITWKNAHVASTSAPLGEHLAHAAGLAWAARTKKDDVVALAFFGDALAASGDLHNGLNFAGVFKAPVVYVCRNVEGALGDRGVAYGVDVLRVDGTDVVAVLAAAREAVDHAAKGLGPIILDCALDQAIGDAKNGAAIDPIARMRKLLDKSLSDADDAKLRGEIEAEIAVAEGAAGRTDAPAPETIFDDVYATVPPHLAAQRDELRRTLR